MIILTNFKWTMMAILYLQNFTVRTVMISAGCALAIKYAQADSFSMNELNIEKRYLDEMHIKVDNIHKRYFLTSFYYKERGEILMGFIFMYGIN